MTIEARKIIESSWTSTCRLATSIAAGGDIDQKLPVTRYTD